MVADEVLISIEGPIGVVTLNRPSSLNAADEALHGRLVTVWDELARHEELRAVVVTGAGKAFSAGGDLPLLERMTADDVLRRRVMGEAAAIVRAMVGFPIPIIAAVNGPAVGLGCSLAGLSDLVVMDESAFFSDPHVSLGLVAGDGAAVTWPRHMGLQRAKEWILLGGRISAAEALRIGLANRVVPDGTALEAAMELAGKVAALPPQAVRETLRAIDAPLRRTVEADVDAILGAETASFDQPEFRANLQRMLARAQR